MREPLKVGDRVRVYGFGENPTATVERVEPDGKLKVSWLGGSWSIVHPKQCRRLRKRERRRIFIPAADLPFESRSTTGTIFDGKHGAVIDSGLHVIEFREVRKRK